MFNEFPYTNYEKINLDWLLDLGKKLKEDAESGAFDGERGPGVFGITTIYAGGEAGGPGYYCNKIGDAGVDDFVIGYGPAAGSNILYLMKITSVRGNYLEGTTLLQITGPQGVQGEPGEVSEAELNQVRKLLFKVDSSDGTDYLMQGAWAYSSGQFTNANNYICSKSYIPNTVKKILSEFNGISLLAYENSIYIGAYDFTQNIFRKAGYNVSFSTTELDMDAFRSSYPTYEFKLTSRRVNGSAINPSTAGSEIYFITSAVLEDDTRTKDAKNSLWNEYAALPVSIDYTNGWVNTSGATSTDSFHRITGYLSTDNMYVYPFGRQVFVVYYDYDGSNYTFKTASAELTVNNIYKVPNQYPFCRVEYNVNYNWIKPIIAKSSTSEVLPSYWISYIDAKTDEIKQLVENSDSVFAFVTDIHVPQNQMRSPDIIRYINSKISIPLVVNGGDYMNSNASRRDALNVIDTWITKTNNNWKLIRGNHDTNYQGTGTVTEKDFTTHAIKRLENSIVLRDINKPVYVYDDTQAKIRYIYLDTITENTVDISNQVTWMQSKIAELDASWGVIVITHMYFAPATIASGITALSALNVGVQIKNGLDAIYDTASATIIAYVCGHCHRDYHIVTTKGYPIISTTCDAGGNQAALWDIDNPVRTIGTTLEQAFDIYGIDKTNKTINTIRIGAGNNRQFSFN